MLQHAWAELAHDRNYKFNGQLPKHIERKLYLLAGLMETADNGFSDLSREIDSYVQHVSNSAAEGSLKIELNTLSLEEFVKQWAEKKGFHLEELESKDGFSDLLQEMSLYGIETLDDLSKIIPKDFVEKYDRSSSTVLGLVRDWMIISDSDKFIEMVDADWWLSRSDIDLYEKYLSGEQVQRVCRHFQIYDDDNEESYEDFHEHNEAPAIACAPGAMERR